MDPFASVEDYEARYGAADDEARIQVLLSDASAFIASLPGFSQPTDEAGTANLVRVTCAVVNRSMSAGDWAGFSNVSQSADGLSASATLYNPSGDFFLTKAEKTALGIGRSRMGATYPYACGGAS